MVTSRIRFTAIQKAELWERWKSGAKCVGHFACAGKEEQDRRPGDGGSPWRNCSGAAAQSRGSAEG